MSEKILELKDFVGNRDLGSLRGEHSSVWEETLVSLLGPWQPGRAPLLGQRIGEGLGGGIWGWGLLRKVWGGQRGLFTHADVLQSGLCIAWGLQWHKDVVRVCLLWARPPGKP